MLSSAKRVQALVLEEIALDRPTPLVDHNLLIKSENLHLSALNLAKIAFGERNVQTAKHYGNLGRLYQSMRKYEVNIFSIFINFKFHSLNKLLFISIFIISGSRSDALESDKHKGRIVRTGRFRSWFEYWSLGISLQLRYVSIPRR